MRRKTPKEYYQECKQNGLDLPIEDYKNSNIKINHKCSKGHIYEQTPNHHLTGRGCPICSGKLRKTSKQYYNECDSKGYDLPIEEYVNNKTKIKHKCNKCGNVYKQTPDAHLHGNGCPKCAVDKTHNKQRKTSEEYYQECKSKGIDLPLGEYVGYKAKTKHECINGHTYLQSPSDHLQGHGCPICNESKGERFIRNYLNKNNIKYESQKKFKDLKDKTYLSYDFYLPYYNTLIEYQGIQHYESVSFGGKDKSNLNKQQEHDNLKRKYAKESGYKLLELNYTLDTQELVNRYLKRRITD